ncbi:MAG: Tim44 domain-containing protein, partial [Rhodocyclaceae bacterium]|nr:Tim44 domain-containing protein [Rhodocyclaceae bacterium]
AAADGVRVPDGFDVAAFIGAAKDCYTRVQYARSSADTAALRTLMDEDTFAQEQAQPQQPSAGEVLALEVRLLDVRQDDEGEVASVEFSGMQGAGASGGGYVPFREVWSMARPAAGQGAWRVAGIQPLAV